MEDPCRTISLRLSSFPSPILVAFGVYLIGRFVKSGFRPLPREAGVNIQDIPWLVVAVSFGGVIAPILLMDKSQYYSCSDGFPVPEL
jgi:hypothetical protein